MIVMYQSWQLHGNDRKAECNLGYKRTIDLEDDIEALLSGGKPIKRLTNVRGIDPIILRNSGGKDV